jgi:peptidase MA superfamily protein/tetratricopeptide repeat protein
MARRVTLIVWLAAVSASAATAQSRAPDAAERGWQALQAGDAERAAAIFRTALANHPSDPDLLFGAGVAAHLRGREDEAAAMLKQALRVEPRLTQASALLGEISYERGDLDFAIRTYEAALSHAPSEVAMRQRLETWRREASVHAGFESLKDDRFAIMFSGPVEQKLAERATTVLGSAFWQIGNGLGAYPSDPINVILYTGKQFRDITGAPEWAGGGFDGQIRLPVRGAAQNLRQFDRVLIHELTHAMLHALARQHVPAWLHEGLAMYFDGHDAAASGRRLAAARVFVPLALLQTSFGRLNAAQAAVAYEQSAVAVHALVDRIGLAGIGTLLQDLDAGQTVDEAIVRHGFTLPDFEAQLARRAGVTRATPARR